MKIFIVDDDTEQRMIMVEHLANSSDILREFADGKALIAGLEEAPDLILLDIEMPEIDGITACRMLRNMGHEHIQVIFISAHDDIQTRMAAYAAGGSDFIVKPFLPVDLLAKIEVARTLMARHASFASDIQLARRTAFTAMSSMGELGVVLQFLRTSFTCVDTDDLASALMKALSEYGLAGTVELRLGSSTKAYSSQGACTPLERSVLAHAQSLERIFRFHSQMAINYPHATFVIMNLPDDMDRVGRLQDHLAALAEGVDARIVAMVAEAEQRSKSQAILQQAAELTKALDTIDKQQTDHRLRLLTLGTKYLDELTCAFTSLGLSERQESMLYAMAQKANERNSAVIDDSTDIAAQLRSVAMRLRKLA